MAALRRTKVLAAQLLPRLVCAGPETVVDAPPPAVPSAGTPTDGDTGPRPQRVGVTFEYEDKLSAPVPSRRRVRVRWRDPMRRVFLVKKWRNKAVSSVALEVASWLTARGVLVVVEGGDLEEYNGIAGIVALDTSEDQKTAVDLVVSLGGDGTLLHASRLFRFLECGGAHDLLPPCLVLGLGSLGFLATVDASNWRQALDSALRGHLHPVPCTLRTRLRCTLRAANTQQPVATWHALNECVVLSRGQAIGKLQVLVDGSFVTLVEGDGLIVSSPTGSTGYNMSCGGPIVSPSVPGTLLTPIAPASLSFRPVLISEMSSIEVLLPVGARTGEASVVLDGRQMGTLQRGGSVHVVVARPIPVLNVAGLDRDWFAAITNKLKWNARDVEQADADCDKDAASR